MTFVVDLSMGWPSLTGAVLKGIGATGVIGYAGCDYGPKNVSKARFEDWCESGLTVGLVIENGERDMLGGSKAGAELGEHLANAADALGYDVAHCVLGSAADFDAVGEAEYEALVDAMSAFASYIPVPAYYGDGDSIDRVFTGGFCVYGWQSSSTSYSPGGTSPHAALQQHYNDPRAQSLAVDINDVLKTPLYFMGETMQIDGFTDTGKAALVSILNSEDVLAALWGRGVSPLPVPDPNNPGQTMIPPWPTNNAPIWQYIADSLTRIGALQDDNAQMKATLAGMQTLTITDAQVQAIATAVAALHTDLTEADVVDAITKTIKIGATA